MNLKFTFLAIGLFIPLSAFALPDGFVHPSTFNGSENEKNAVLDYIKQDAKDNMTELDIDSPSTLRMLEKSELSAFKKLTQATDKELLNKVIDTYCDDIDMCSYSILQMMYAQDLKASKEELSW
ncbi:hypothetical protein ACLIXB_004040 [Yersinia enterocolitica]|nr:MULTISPECIES: hypothetical protein [Yersinia]EKN4790619.1 hypothetical protein [Yersinia enterocolitica]EKN4883160.1 hypothetical protein [Yersinia enterocolitica]EKN5112721.1 hypothetical protein [Yersinia enterocolitica]EKN6093291.1 hypothetical protein [Yersinia enterocolitica]EKN6127507.1 hypothetical protein [Yersinia enterocolitica]